MKKILLLFIIGLLNISCNGQTKFSEATLSCNLSNLDDSKISFQDILKKYEGKKIVIEVWASWCGDCVKNMPKLRELQNNNLDAVFIFLSVDKTAEAWRKGIEKHDLKGDHYLIANGMKGEFGKSINLDWIPRYIIVDKTGKIVLYKAIETDFDKVNTTIQKIQ
jgi:thiol-disulfide isomerase/thioredoxin